MILASKNIWPFIQRVNMVSVTNLLIIEICFMPFVLHFSNSKKTFLFFPGLNFILNPRFSMWSQDTSVFIIIKICSAGFDFIRNLLGSWKLFFMTLLEWKGRKIIIIMWFDMMLNNRKVCSVSFCLSWRLVFFRSLPLSVAWSLFTVVLRSFSAFCLFDRCVWIRSLC